MLAGAVEESAPNAVDEDNKADDKADTGMISVSAAFPFDFFFDLFTEKTPPPVPASPPMLIENGDMDDDDDVNDGPHNCDDTEAKGDAMLVPVPAAAAAPAPV